MRVLKIIQANPEVFDIDQNKSYSEREAIRIVASMDCQGSEIQKEIFEIQQLHTSIRNLIYLGFSNSAVELSIMLIPKSEQFQQYNIAQDLCDGLIHYFYQEGNLEAVHIYKTLYDKYSLIIKGEHETKLMFGKAIHNYKYVSPIDKIELTLLLDSLKSKLPYDALWYHYYYYQCKSLLHEGEELEQTYLEAIRYFENLHAGHYLFVKTFYKELAQFYNEKKEHKKAEKVINKLEALSDRDF